MTSFSKLWCQNNGIINIMINKNSQISLTIELEGSVILGYDIKTKEVLVTKTIRNKKGDIVPLMKDGKPVKTKIEVEFKEPKLGKAYKHINLPSEFIENSLETPLKGYKVKHWKSMNEIDRITLHLKELCEEFQGKLLNFSLIS